jgi:hypothetical protein
MVTCFNVRVEIESLVEMESASRDWECNRYSFCLSENVGSGHNGAVLLPP